MMVNGKKIRCQVREHITTVMELSTKESGRVINIGARESLNFPMELSTKGNGRNI